jgi:protocatechuate 3,4-dioxygenase beta subunit
MWCARAQEVPRELSTSAAPDWRRRTLLRAVSALPAVLLLESSAGRGRSRILAATPECKDGDDATPRQTAGPFFKPNSPRRTSFVEAGTKGTRILLQGQVRSIRCQAVAGALLDLWHADAAGRYDNAGYDWRGHQFADETGRYAFETVVPGLYPGRTRHFHIRVQAPNRAVLTTQLYFPGESQNRGDGLFNQKLLLALRQSGGNAVAVFDFALPLD